MSDFGSPVAQNVDVSPDKGLQTLSGLLSLKQKQQALDTGAFTQQSAKAQATVDTQNAQEKMAGAQLLADPVANGLTDDEGNPTKDARAKILSVMPTTGDKHYQDLLTAATGHVQFKNAALKLRGDVKSEASARLAGVAADPHAGLPEIQDAITNLKNDYAGTPAESDVNTIANVSSQAVEAAAKAHGVAGAKQVIMGFSRGYLTNAGITGAGGIAAPQAGVMSSGASQQPGTFAPPLQGGAFTPSGAPTAQVTPPAVMTGPGGQVVRVPAGGAGLPTLGGGGAPGAPQGSPHPRTASDDAPPPNAPRAVQDAYAVATKNANEHLETVRNADEGYGNNKAISSAVRRLASDASTGPGTETWNHAMGVLNTKGANNYQELGAFLDRQAATVRGQMGLPGTNAGAEDAKMIAGNTQYNAKVIQDKNDYTESLTEGLHQYRNGLDRVAGFSGQASPKQIAQFKSAWTNSFDPNVYIGENAYKRSKADGDKFIASLDPKEAASLSEKRKALKALAAGKMP